MRYQARLDYLVWPVVTLSISNSCMRTFHSLHDKNSMLKQRNAWRTERLTTKAVPSRTCSYPVFA